MLSVKYDAMFVIVYIWRILESPFAIINSQWHNSMVLSCRMIDPSGISFIFHAKLAFWIRTLFCILCCCNRFWIFLGFGKVDRNVDLSVWTVYFPFHIFLDTVSSDIVCILAKFIEKFRCLLWTFFIICTEFFNDLTWFWCHDTH